MNNNNTAIVNGNENSNCIITEAGVYKRDFIYDENTGSESEVIRYIKKQQVQIDNSLVIADQSRMSQIGIDDVAWILPVASAGAAIYLAITEGPDLIHGVLDKAKKWFE